MASAKKQARRPRRQYTEEEKAGFREKQQNELKEIAASIEKGVASFHDSDRYKEFLTVMSSFPQYSYRNVMLIMQQNPRASLVAGFNKWKDLGRHVKKGEKGLRILAPMVRKVKDDPERAAPEEAQERDEGKAESRIYGFLPVSVFDVSQTDGKPLPETAVEPSQAVNNPQALMDALQTVSEVPIVLVDPERMDALLGPDTKGMFTTNAGLTGKAMGVPGIPPGGMICVRDGMSDAMTVKTTIHELAHSVLHGQNAEHAGDARPIKEFDAESVAFVVSKHLGIDTDDYTFPYLSSWANDKTPQILQSELPLIVRTASDIISRLDPQYEREMLRAQAETELAPGSYRVWQIVSPDRDAMSAEDIVPASGIIDRSGYDVVCTGDALAFGSAADGQTAEAILGAIEENPPKSFDADARLNVVEIKGTDGSDRAWCMTGGRTAVPLVDFSPQTPPRERPQIRHSEKKTEKKQEALTR